MTVKEVRNAGKRHPNDVHFRRSLTLRRHATTSTTTMDQKELEDRLAAAEALSSLGFASAFRDSNPVSQVNSEPGSTPKSSESAKPRARGRSAKEKSEHGTGRESKSRSTRGRGRGKAVQHDGNTAMSEVPPTLSAQADSLQSLPRQLTTTPETVSTSRGRGTGRGRGRGGSRQGTKLTPPAAQNVAAPTTQIVRGLENSGPPTASAGRVHHANVAVVPATISVPRHAVGANKFVASSSVSSLPVSSSSPSASLSSSSSSSSSSSAAAAAAAAASTSASSFPSSASASHQLAPVVIRMPVSSSSPAASSGVLPSQTNLASLRLDSLPSFSLGSTGLPNLSSIPNLPSLPSAIASLQLGNTSISQEGGAVPQLSPHSRDNDDKSLPLKKRKIIDSSSLSSISLLPRPSPVSPVSRSPSVSSPAVSHAAVTDAASLTEVTANTAVPGKPADVASPAPAPVALLSQVLPPAMCMQLISEINTAITPDEDGDVPLHIAVVHENEAMVKKLIQLMALAGHKVDRYNKQHQTPLHLAVKLISLPAIQMLLEAGADPNLVDSVGLTSTHMAVQGRDSDCLEALLQWSKFSCDLNNRNFEGLTPLHTAVINNDLEIVTRLLDQGADINMMDGKSGRTVLFHAAETNQKAAVELLLNRGADPEIANYAGVVPAMAAQGRSHTTVARLLARALDEVVEDEKGEEKEKMEIQKTPDPSHPSVPLEMLMTDERSRTPQSSAQEKGKAMPVKMAGHLVTTKAMFPTEAQAGVTMTPPILQSSSVPGNTTRGQLLKTAVPQALTKEAEPTSVVRTMLPGNVPKATHQLPVVIAKSGSTTSVASRAAPQAKSSASASDPVPMDTIPAQSRIPSRDVPWTARSAKTATSVRRDSAPCEKMPLGLSRSAAGVKRESTLAKALLAESAGPVSVKRDPSPEEVRNSEQVPLMVGSSVVSQENIAKALIVMRKAMAERQNGGQPGGVNLPVLPGVLPLGLNPSLGETSVSGVAGGSRYVPLTGISRVTPLPVPTSSVVTSPALSGIGLMSPPSTAIPSAAYSQPTRPLLLFRSMSNDPGSGEGRRMGSVEVRHVTADALLALQHCSSNSVNPANQNLKSAPANFEQQLCNLIAARAGGAGGLGGVPMETERMPPFSNHVSRGTLQHRSYSFDMDSYSDEPKDLSLKSKKKETAKTEPASGELKWESPPSPAPIPEKKFNPPGGSKEAGHAEKKRKTGSAQQDPSKPSRRTQRAKGSRAQSRANTKTGAGAKSSAVLSQSVPEKVTPEGAAKTADFSEGRTISISESGLIVASEPDSDNTTPVIQISRGLVNPKQEGLPSAVESLRPGDSLQGRSVPIIQPVIRQFHSGVATAAPGKTTPPKTFLISNAQNVTSSAAKDGSDQNDNVSETFPKPLVLEKMLRGELNSRTGSDMKRKEGEEAMETD